MAYKFQLGDAILSGSIQASDDTFVEDKKALAVGTDKDGKLVFDSDGSISNFAGGMVISGSNAANSVYLAGSQGRAKSVLIGVKGREYIKVDDGNNELELGQPTKVGATLNANSGFQLAGASVTATAAELNYLDNDDLSAARIGYLGGVTAGTAIASKAVVLDANKDVTGINDLSGSAIRLTEGLIAASVSGSGDVEGQHSKFRQMSIGYDGAGGAEGHLKLGAGGDMQLAVFSDNATILNNTAGKDIVFQIKQGSENFSPLKVEGATRQVRIDKLSLSGTLVTATAAELNYLDNDDLEAADLTKLAAVTATAAELNYLDNTDLSAARIAYLAGVTAGTAIASKAVVLDANKDVTGLKDVTGSAFVAAAGGGYFGQNGFTIGSAGQPDAIKMNSTGVVINSPLKLNNDLHVSGSVITVDAQNSLFYDNLIGLGFASGSNDRAIGDKGLIFGLEAENDVAFWWDESASQFGLATTATHTTGSVIVPVGYSDLRVGKLIATTVEATIAETVQTVATTATLDAAAGTIVLLNASGGSRVLTLPAANHASVSGVILKFKKISTGANTFTIHRAGTDTIDGAHSLVLESDHAAVSLINNGSNAWYVM
tara:strand:- start:760 stop:2565 length:1806 start_codon:yes stop_codon:yes gene_type:complete